MTAKHSPLASDDVKIEVLRLSNEGLSQYQIAEIMGTARSTIGHFLNKKTHRKWWASLDDKPIAAGDVFDHYKKIHKFDNKRFIVTSAQNNTYVHRKFLQSLETMAKEVDAKILVGTFSYNKSGFQNLEKGDGEWYDPLIEDYIFDEPAILANGLIWCGELNILPTATNPLSGFQSYTRSSSGIIPHVKVQMESIPTHKSQETRFLYTTGAVTRRNYIQKKAGQKASFHHIFGALLVEVDPKTGDWFVRQLIADDNTGEFYDLDKLYTPTGVVENQRVEAINWGDIHIEKIDEVVAAASFFNENSMLNVLKPKFQFFHDSIDFEARNHHNIKDPYFRFRMYKENREEVKQNIAQLIEFLKRTERENTLSVIVESNHDLALKRWLKESDYKTDPANAIFYLECQLEIYKQMEKGVHDFHLLEWLVKKELNSSNIKFLKTDDSFKICNEDGNGIECGSHGHLGNNGARGSINSYTKLEARYNIGHSHSAAIKDGVYVAGVCADIEKMDYAKGASGWSHSHIITYPNSRRAIVTIKRGNWRVENV